MLSTVLMLAAEMGIFSEDNSLWQNEAEHDNPKIAREYERFLRLRCLIWVYATQQPGRPGRQFLDEEILCERFGKSEANTGPRILQGEETRHNALPSKAPALGMMMRRNAGCASPQL
jgi:hypothetical protein